MIEKQRHFFLSGKTLSFSFRIEQLKKLKVLIRIHEPAILQALQKDLYKSAMEAYGSEIVLIYKEIDEAIKYLKKWMQPVKVRTPFPMLWPGRSEIHHQPYGCVLIIAPWNYPFILALSPLIGAISAGNCVVIKPSEVSTHSENVMISLLQDFPAHYITTIQGAEKEVTLLLQEQFDYIFFTGSTAVGKIIMEAAAKHLTPLTLELGGKSPCIIDATADLDFAARRIIWGKMLNAGQTCIAPDYLYVQRDVKDALISKLKHTIHQFYGEDAEKSDSYGRIINDTHFERLITLLNQSKVIVGGKYNAMTRYIEPSLIETDSWQDAIMQTEIFGPLLPILTYNSLDEVISQLQSKPKPLALYAFTDNKATQQKILQHLSFGGGCINDCLLQVANHHLPFGGVGLSGLGGYHGKYSFELFSHRKSIYQKRLLLDVNLQYPPYTDRKFWWLKRILGR